VVNKIVPTITWATPAPISSGTALSATQLNATASVPGTFIYSPAAGTVLSAGTTTLNVTFTPTDSANYSTKTASVSLVVNSGAPTITWATPAAIAYGTALSSTQLNATASAPGSFVYSPASGTVLGAGTNTLKVTYTPTNTAYPSQTATVSLVVNKATPTITWPAPASIAVGTVLSVTQLNATASVPGSFVYSPALGVIPTSGTVTLSVTFTPTDTANYNTATASVSLSVTGGSTSSATNIAIGTTVAQTGMKRLGMNISGQSYYDSSQMLRNLVFRNPGFEGEIWQSILKCVAVTSTSCTDMNSWAQWPANFVQGASYEFIYGGAAGQTGTVTSSTAASSGANQGVTINFAQGGKTPKVGDFVIVRMTVPGNPQAGWWTSVSGGATLAPEYSDLSPSTVGKQALRVTAAGSGQSANVTSYFDTYGGHSFVQLNGSYKVTFRAKGVGGSNQLGLTFQRQATTGNETFLYQTISVGSSWQDYSYTVSANETGSSIGNVKLAFDVNGASVLLDDVSVTPVTVSSSNPTPFRDEVVKALTDLKPGVIRYNDGANTGSTIDNIIAPAFARQRAGASEQVTVAEDVALGLHEFLQLCQTVGAEPYYNTPAAMSATEMKNLIEYLGGDSSTPYGAKRAAMGQAAPWTSVFPTIHLELGNEQWNSGIFAGSAISDPVAYGQRAATIFAAAKSSSSYNASSFDLVLGSWAVIPWWTSQETSNSANYDSVSVGPYIFNTLNDTSSNEAVFGPMFAEPEMVDSVSTGFMYQQAQAAKAAGTKIVVYEVNLGAQQGSANQAAVTSTMASVGSGITVAEHMLLMARDLGITTQNLWALPGYNNGFSSTTAGSISVPLFGSVIDMGGQTNLRRPTYLAEQLANTAILPTILTSTLSGANPTWVQALSSNDSVELNGAHEIQSIAFTDGGKNRSVIVFNLSRTTARPVTFSGTNIPTGTVNVGQLTSANLTDTNETTGNVKLTNSTLSNFQSSTPYSLPPFSMTVFTWQQ
jgi:alpha-L-arabinofuranosidase/2-keto-3-deoxy-6-phosphogluconate aldolase